MDFFPRTALIPLLEQRCVTSGIHGAWLWGRNNTALILEFKVAL